MWLRLLLQSFEYAYEGITYALMTQRNLRIHFGIAFVVMLLCLVLRVSKLEIILVFFSIVLVMATELINTAIESVVDLATPTFHRLAKIAKDSAAAAVLLTALHAVVVGILVFYDKLLPLQIRPWSEWRSMALELFLVAIGPMILLFIVIGAVMRRKNTIE